MAIQRVLALIAGKIQEYIPITTSAGAGSAGAIPALDAAGKLDITMMPNGVGADISTITASESIAAGALVNVYQVSGATKVRNADGTTAGKEAHGYVLSAYSASDSAMVYFTGIITGLSGLTQGPVFLSDSTLGGISGTGATTANHVYQQVGIALSASSVLFQPLDPIIRS
jgi:hypothetical protein